MVERFESSTRQAKKENILTSVLVTVLAAGMLYWGRGEQDLAVLLTFAVAGGVGTFFFYTWRDRNLGGQVVEISPQVIQIQHRRGSQQLEWQQIQNVQHSLYGGEHWTLTPNQGRPLVLRAEGFTLEQGARIGELIERYYAASHQADKAVE